jgi:hypothetical protein
VVYKQMFTWIVCFGKNISITSKGECVGMELIVVNVIRPNMLKYLLIASIKWKRSCVFFNNERVSRISKRFYDAWERAHHTYCVAVHLIRKECCMQINIDVFSWNLQFLAQCNNKTLWSLGRVTIGKILL